MAAARESTRLDDPLWYKDAIIYQIHAKSFFDSNDDGVGDFRGLTEKLDYIESLGVSAIWLLPFYPSPQRDDGYDIADYRSINPAYGNRRDFRTFIREAHRRGLRVITELVVNHTSDQHPWFQAARHAPKGSAKRDFYVWSDTDDRLAGTRIIFTDTEESNWAWDPVAQQYYWHRFFSHQPDLNHNNPAVVKAVIRVMQFWLDLGVDGLRLDAIPYLCVREGTSNENLPETHEVIRQIRAAVDARYDDRMLLAEANQWPEDVRDYFGDGDECHMAYHFPLMPRMYMAIAQEDRHPIVEIMQQTPEIPESCQWAVFLRNHDELTLEMVTDRERDYMYHTYASDPRMRINVGIRRRLAPLMDNDIDKIRLMNSLLLSMPGSPIIYYGDELGMGDNYYLGDRNAVRTPMQWSPDRNGGFSKADPQSLFLPPIMDPVYGYQAVNVEAQSRDPSSLLNWMRKVLSVRRRKLAFGRGSLTFLRPGNRKVLAYVREYHDEVLLCVANLSRRAQPVELDLSRFEGRVPVEMVGGTPFPPIGRLPYLLTLPSYGFYWFELDTEVEAPVWHEDQLAATEPPWIVLFDGLATFAPDAPAVPGRSALLERLGQQMRREVLPEFLARQRWFAAKGETLHEVDFAWSACWRGGFDRWRLTLVRVALEAGEPQLYFLPLGLCWEREEERVQTVAPSALARVRQKADTGRLFDALGDPVFSRELVLALKRGEAVPLGEARLTFTATHVLDAVDEATLLELPVRRTRTEGSNSTLLVGDLLFLKSYRRIRRGINPEWEMGRYLTERSPCEHVVPVAGAVELHPPHEEPVVLAVVQAAVPNQGDAWSHTLDHLRREIGRLHTQEEEADGEGPDLHYQRFMHTLGDRTAALHLALARPTEDPAFAPEPVEAAWAAAWAARIAAEAETTSARLEARRGALPEAVIPLVDRFLARRAQWPSLLEGLVPSRLACVSTRYHGDFHLAQVLLAEDDVVITDLEGEPGRTLEERREKHTPLRDVAGLLRSIDYARAMTLDPDVLPESAVDPERVQAFAGRWHDEAVGAFLAAYEAAVAGSPVWPAEPGAARALLALAGIEKALYEIRYELDNRPGWLRVPLAGIEALLEAGDDFGTAPQTRS